MLSKSSALRALSFLNFQTLFNIFASQQPLVASRARILRYPGDLVYTRVEGQSCCVGSWRIISGGEPIAATSPFEPIDGDDEQEDRTPLSHFMY